MEMRQELTYTVHHIQKILAFFSAMRAFQAVLVSRGHQVIYLTLDDPANRQDLADNIFSLIEAGGHQAFAYLLPDEYRLDKQLIEICQTLQERYGVQSTSYDTEHFLISRSEFASWAKTKKSFLLETFYRQMREKFNILLDPLSGEPVGGQWNFDKENQKRFDRKEAVPPALLFEHDVSAILEMIMRAEIPMFGNIQGSRLEWPISREEAIAALNHFCENRLYRFGTFEDAMDTAYKILFHSRLSFALNIKLLSPLEVIEAVVDTWKKSEDAISLPQVEGFVRQVLGWREYMRGIYWLKMPGFAEMNFFGHTRPLPSWYWNAKTRMNCLHHVIGQSLDLAWAHHIQRLMITGNFSMLAGMHPDEVDQWYLGIYIDAIEWVEITNTRGMSQFADGGIIGTKPYAASANYINKMSNYCQSCSYDYTRRHGENACPFNSLYWSFFSRNAPLLARNPRLGMVYKNLARMTPQEHTATMDQAAYYLDHLEEL